MGYQPILRADEAKMGGKQEAELPDSVHELDFGILAHLHIHHITAGNGVATLGCVSFSDIDTMPSELLKLCLGSKFCQI